MAQMRAAEEVQGTVGIARMYLCLEEGERAEERENCHGKLTKEMMPKWSWENRIGVCYEDKKEYQANRSQAIIGRKLSIIQYDEIVGCYG